MTAKPAASTTPARVVPVDAVLLVGFGGPTAPDEVMPFLRTVTAGRGVPDERLEEVAAHYMALGGRSPYNEITLRQAAALEGALAARGAALPVHVGFRNAQPFVAETVARLAALGVRHAAGVVLAAHRSEASLTRYLEAVSRARADVGAAAPAVTYVEPWYEEPRFLEAHAQLLEHTTGYRSGAWPRTVPLVFTAHSIPREMADRSPYVSDLRASARGIAGLLGVTDWELAYQSRSGDPRTPWLDPDVNDVLRRRAAAGVREVAVQAIGFLSDHVEVLYDLDHEARATAAALGLAFRRAPCVNDHPLFIELLAGRVRATAARAA